MENLGLKRVPESWSMEASVKRSKGTRVSNIIQLPDEILSYIFSLLTIRDSGRARLSTSKWLHLPDSRPVLQFDPVSVFGKTITYRKRRELCSQFLGIVDWFMQQMSGDYSRINKIPSLVVEFALANEHSSYIDKWIATCIDMGAEEICLNFGGTRYEGEEKEELYVFPCHLLHPPFLKRLSLTLCTLSLSSECRSCWLSHLTTLELSHVRLSESQFDHILSEGSNLLSLALSTCSMPQTVLFMNGQLQRLKKLSIRNLTAKVKLSCPSLEEFKATGYGWSVTFVDVPLLTQVTYKTEYDSSVFFDHFTMNAPKLQVLSIFIRQEVRPLLATLARCSLKQLNLVVMGSIPYDIMPLTYILNASPFLETLHIELDYCYEAYYSQRRQQREYPEQPHFHLKNVNVFGSFQNWNAMELATYLLKTQWHLRR